MSRADRIARSFQESEAAYKQKRVDDWQAQLPSPFHGKSIEEDLVGEHWQGRINRSGILSIRRFLEEPTKFLILQGEKGLGKSTLAATIGTELINKGLGSAYYRSLPSLLQEFSFPDRDELDPVVRCVRPAILFLDDIGAATEGISPHQKRALWSVIDSRWGYQNKVTILTTNMAITSTADGQGLADWFGDSAWDRIQDSLTHVMFSGESFRG